MKSKTIIVGLVISGLVYAKLYDINLSNKSQIKHSIYKKGDVLELNTDNENVKITKEILHGGKQEGVEIIHVDNGKLNFDVILTRGMNILNVRMGDIRLGWDSSIKEVVHPKFINLERNSGFGWTEGFNEFIARCGIEYAGHPGTDKYYNELGDQVEKDLTLHGKISNIPSSEVYVTIDKVAPYTIRIKGRVDERNFLGSQFQLWTEISTIPNSNKFTINDTLTNLSAKKKEFMLIYSTNFGTPLLEAGSKLLVAAKKIIPFNDYASKQDIKNWNIYSKPNIQFIEEVYKIIPFTDKLDNTTVQLQNANGDKGVSMKWNTKELPYLTQWKQCGDIKDGYVTGIQPGTSYPHNRRWERKKNRVSQINPGDSRTFSITFEIQNTKQEVDKITKEINNLRNNQETTLEKEQEDNPF